MKNMTTGQRIAARRKLANLSQEALSEELGVSRQAISKWESDAGLPDIDNLISLSKIFGVSVGWLLGTEADPNFDPSTGLSDAQLKMVEEIIHRSKPRSHRGLIALGLALSICATAILGIFFQGRLNDLSQENAAAQSQISALEQSNQTLITQMDAINASLSKQDEQNKLLRSAHLKAYLNDDLSTVSVSFYLFPKLFQENAQAYVTVLNYEGTNNILETIQCIPSGELYFCQAELPVANGYRYSFLLATDSGFQEQDLTDMGYTTYFQDLYDATRYHLHSSAQVRSEWSAGEQTYSFRQPIGSPIIDTRSPYVGYESVEAVLYLNGEIVHSESLRDAFKEYGGAYMRFELPYTLNFQAQLPPLTPGDRLTLEITATSYEGNVFTGTLEELVVTE